MLTLIGLGLNDEGDVSLKGIKTAKEADALYAELYTLPWNGDIKKLESEIGKKIEILPRSALEENSRKIIEEAKEKDVALFVGGDPLAATTHSALIEEARAKGISTNIIHASSIFSAIAECGLQLYKFGKVATVAYPQKNFFPKTPYHVLGENLDSGLHTMLLLDVKSEENRFMSVAEAIDVMLQIENEEKKGIFTPETMIVGAARLGGDSVIKWGKTAKLLEFDFGGAPHVIVVPGKLHFGEEEFLTQLAI